jgi:hypothetical protein
MAAALDGKREGESWRARCPVHGGRSLIISERRGVVLFNCRGGCPQTEVLAALCDLGLFGGERRDRNRISWVARKRWEDAEVNAEIARVRRGIDRARSLWARAGPAAGTSVEIYLRSRDITRRPECLRFLPHCPHRSDPGYDRDYYPAMVAPVVDVTGRLIGVHKTFLKLDGTGKADLPKRLQRETCGPIGGGAVRLAMPRDGEELTLAEGIESTLSAMQLFGQPGWAALSAAGIAAVELPFWIRSALICADHDANAVGLEAALTATERLLAEGRAVRLRLPRQVGTDFNDILRAGK